MSGWFGDLVAPRLSFAETAFRYTAAEVADTLAGLAGSAAAPAAARLYGPDRGAQPRSGPCEIGTSLYFAPHPGLGFGREDFLHPDAGNAPSPRRLQEAAVRGAEVETVRRLAETAALPFPVEPVTGIGATWDYGFVAAYRRRIVYRLAFAASLEAGSLAPLCEFLPALARDGAALPAAITPEIGFSLCYNLLAALDRAIAYERVHAAPHPALGTVPQRPEARRHQLAEELERLSDGLRARMHADGRLALEQLWKELEVARGIGFYDVLRPPHWGTLAPA